MRCEFGLIDGLAVSLLASFVFDPAFGISDAFRIVRDGQLLGEVMNAIKGAGGS